jgi:hypothetical protein
MSWDISSNLPDASEVLTITPGKDYTLMSLKEQVNLPATTLKVKEFVKKVTSADGEESEMGIWVFWESKTTEIKGTDITGKKFELMIRCKYTSTEGPDIWTRLDWIKDLKDEKQAKGTTE